MSEHPRHRSTLILCFAIVYLVWGSSYLATRIGVQELPPLLFGGVRFTLAGLLLYGFARATGRPSALEPAELRHATIIGILVVLVSNGCNVLALQWVPSNQAALLNASSAFWIALLGMFGPRATRVSGRVWFGLAVGFLGTALLLRPSALIGSERLWPQLLILLGCLGWACGTIYWRNADSRLDLLSFTGLQMFIGGVMLTAVGLAAGEAARWSWQPRGIAALLYLLVFSSLIAYTAYAWLSKNTSPAQVGTYGYVNPAIATFLGWWVLDERLTAIQLIGTVVILGGVLLVSWPAAAGRLGN